jgi:hypothetical protein
VNRWPWRRKPVSLAKLDAFTWSYLCFECNGSYRFPDHTNMKAFIDQHKAWHRGEHLSEDWS